MLTVDDRCSTCERAGKTKIYRMVGACSNCGTGDVLVLFTAGHSAETVDCPKCGTHNLRSARLATDDEIPVA